MSLEGKRVVITGGGSGSGLATARAAVERGASVVIVGRTADKLEAAKTSLGAATETRVLDVTDEAGVEAFFAEIGAFDHLVTAASGVVFGRVLELQTAAARDLMESKYWGQYYSAKHGAPIMSPNSSITFFSGWLGQKPMTATSSFAAADGAVEALARVLALELAPIRVNTVVPGLLDLSSDPGSQESREAYSMFAKALPTGRVGTPEDVAGAVVYLMENGFTTGEALSVDGGQGAGLAIPSIEDMA